MATSSFIYRSNKPDAKTAIKTAYEQTVKAWGIPVESKFITTSFGKTHILVTGQEYAEPLFLFHGFAFSSTMWIENIRALSESYRIYAVDFLGDINKSEATRPILSKEDCAFWYGELLSGLGLKKAHIGGHSYGGFITLVLGVYAADRVNKLITMSPGGGFQKQGRIFFLKCLLAGIFPSTERITKLMNYMTGRGNHVNEIVKKQFVIAMQNALPRTKLFAVYLSDMELGKIQSPVLLIVGDQEVQYNPHKAISRARLTVPHVQVQLIENAGHGLPLEQPEQVNNLMLDFLRKG